MLQRHNMMLVEMIMAMAFAVIVFTAFFAIMDSLGKTNKIYRAEARATLALDNTLERLEAEKSPDMVRVERILTEELAESGLNSDGKISHNTIIDNGKCKLTIYLNVNKGSKRKLAEVSLQCPR